MVNKRHIISTTITPSFPSVLFLFDFLNRCSALKTVTCCNELLKSQTARGAGGGRGGTIDSEQLHFNSLDGIHLTTAVLFCLLEISLSALCDETFAYFSLDLLACIRARIW